MFLPRRATKHSAGDEANSPVWRHQAESLTTYVLAQRLARAHDMLTDPRHDVEEISTVAYDCGFGVA
jgi:AraC-like DNA-binding protein